MQKSTSLCVMAAAVSALMPQPATSCGFLAPFEPDDIKLADAVVVGSVSHYEVLDGYAVLTIDVESALEGEEYVTDPRLGYDQQVLVSWQNSTFNLPEEMTDERRIFALRQAGSESPPLRGPSAVIRGDLQGYEYAILQAPCAPPFMFPYSRIGERNIQTIIDGGSPMGYVYHDPDNGSFWMVSELRTRLKQVGALAFLLLVTTAITFWKNRKLKRQLRTLTAGDGAASGAQDRDAGQGPPPLT